jgi:hypothetical protein
MSAIRSDAKELLELFQRCFMPGSGNLDSAIGPVPNPSGQVGSSAGLSNKPPKPYPLNPSPHDDV